MTSASRSTYAALGLAITVALSGSSVRAFHTQAAGWSRGQVSHDTTAARAISNFPQQQEHQEQLDLPPTSTTSRYERNDRHNSGELALHAVVAYCGAHRGWEGIEKLSSVGIHCILRWGARTGRWGVRRKATHDCSVTSKFEDMPRPLLPPPSPFSLS